MSTRGVHALEDIRLRCWCDPDTGCWRWKLCVGEHGAARVYINHPDGRREHMNGRRAAKYLQTGQPIPTGMVVFAADMCKTTDCVNPAHSVVGTKAEWGEWLSRSGILRRRPSKIAAAVVAGAARRKLTDEQCDIVRSTDRPVPELAAEWGVACNTLYAIRRGVQRRTTVPNSVFAWLPAREAA